MFLEDLRKIVKNYEATFYLRKIFRGEHDEVKMIKKYLDKYSVYADTYNLTDADEYDLISQLNLENYLSIIQEIRQYFNSGLINCLKALKDFNIDPQPFYSGLKQFVWSQTACFCAIFSEAKQSNHPLYELLNSASKETKTLIVESILSLLSTNYYTNQKNIVPLFCHLQEHQLFKKEVLTAILQSGQVTEITEIIAYFSGRGDLDEETMLHICKQPYLFYFKDILALLKKHDIKEIDKKLLLNICSEIKLELKEILPALIESQCCNNETLASVMKMDTLEIFCNKKLITALASQKLLDQEVFNYINTKRSEEFFAFSSCMSVLLKYQVLDKLLLMRLDKQAAELDKIFSNLTLLRIESEHTIKAVVSAFTQNKTKDLYVMLNTMQEEKQTITENTFMQMCASERLKKISSLIKYFPMLTEAGNLKTCLSLSDDGFEFIYNFISTDGIGHVDQTAFDKLKDIANSLPVKPETTAPYNPYIHGTTSLVFSSLDQTQNTLMPVFKMLENFHLAPMGGEITQGGLDNINAGDQISFGLLDTNRDTKAFHNDYDLQSVLSNYATAYRCYLPEAETLLKYLSQRIERAKKTSFTDINIILVYLARIRQLGTSIDTLNQQVDLPDLVTTLNANKQFIYLLLLLGSYIQPNYNSFAGRDEESKSTHIAAISKYLSRQNIIDKIKKTKLDLESIFKNPTYDNLTKVLQLLTVPQVITLSKNEYETTKPIFLRETCFFTIRSTPAYETPLDPTTRKNALACRDFYDIAQAKYENLTFTNNLVDFLCDKSNANYFSAMKQPALNMIEQLARRQTVLDHLISAEYQPLSKRQLFFQNHIFPLIFIPETNEHIAHFSYQHEYRTSQGMQLGKDIKLIATDTNEHRLMLMKYLDQNHIKNVSVVLFVDLYMTKLTKKKPESPFTHADGLQRLSWLAAKALPQDTQAVIANNDLQKSANLYRRINFL